MSKLMDTSTTDTARAKRLVKLLKKLIAQEHLYTDEQLKDMRKQLRVVEEEMNNLDSKLKKGFG